MRTCRQFPSVSDDAHVGIMVDAEQASWAGPTVLLSVPYRTPAPTTAGACHAVAVALSLMAGGAQVFTYTDAPRGRQEGVWSDSALSVDEALWDDSTVGAWLNIMSPGGGAWCAPTN